jgi:hypothetical protein
MAIRFNSWVTAGRHFVKDILSREGHGMLDDLVAGRIFGL